MLLTALKLFEAKSGPVLEDYLADSTYDQHGRRVVEGQRLMQATGDSFLGWRVGRSGAPTSTGGNSRT